MEKAEPLHIHLDGNLNNSTLFHGRVGWNDFDIRNPKEAYVTADQGEIYRHPEDV